MNTAPVRSSERRRRAQILMLAVILVLLLLLAAVVGTVLLNILNPPGAKRVKAGASTEGMTWVRSIYGWGAAAGQQLNSPSDVAVDPDGNIYTNYTGVERGFVVVFRPDGSYLRSIGPGSMTPGSPSPMRAPGGIDVASNGDIFVTDQPQSKVFVFSSTGKLIRSWDSPGPRDVEVSEDRVYVGAAEDVRIYTRAGKSVATIGSAGRKKDQFAAPVGMAVDDDGTFFVADSLNGRLKAYNQQGKLRWIYPAYGETAKPAASNLSGSSSRDASGNAEFTLPMGVAMDAKGRLLVVDAFDFDISVVEPSDKGAKTTATYGTEGAEDGKFIYPSDIAFDAARDWVVVADTRNNRLQILRLDGTGGANGLAGALRRLSVGPVWVCSLPLLAIILVIVMIVLNRRRRNAEKEHERTTAP